MRYQIFIPNVRGDAKQNLRDVGLEELIPPHDCEVESGEILKGPDGRAGQLIGWPTEKHVLSFNDTHRAVPCVADPVRKLPAARFYWVFSKDSPPSEEDLQRKEMFDGYLVTLAEQDWAVPNVTELPQSFGFDQNGELTKVPKATWKPFVDDAEWALSQVLVPIGGDGVRNWKRELQVAVRFLAANYRVNLELALLLELIEPQNVLSVLMHGVDRSRLVDLAAQLKKAGGAQIPAGSDASAGSEA